jgi:hypothetical protein
MPTATVQRYLDLVPAANAVQPNFIAALTAMLQGFADLQDTMNPLVGIFNPNTAVGQQLDFVGQWVGVSRELSIPLTGVYFSWGVSGVGWGQGTWFQTGDSPSELDALPDDSYRLLMASVISSNYWDGSVPGAYNIWAIVFAAQGYTFLIQDYQDMTMAIIVIGPTITAIMLALMIEGFIILRPAGVGIRGYFMPSVPGAPVFGWGVENSSISGWGVGAWVEPLT